MTRFEWEILYLLDRHQKVKVRVETGPFGRYLELRGDTGLLTDIRRHPLFMVMPHGE